MKNELRPILRSLRPAWLCAGAMMAVALLVQPASAFTIEGGANTTPRFDLEEQSRQFRSPNSYSQDPRYPGSSQSGFQFGTQNSSSPFDMGARARAHQHHYDRMFDPSYQFNAR